MNLRAYGEMVSLGTLTAQFGVRVPVGPLITKHRFAEATGRYKGMFPKRAAEQQGG